MNKRLVHRLVMALAVISLMALCSWGYTNLVVANARSKGEYASAEAGMLARIDKYYSSDHTEKLFYAGPDDRDGRNPYVWYVIAEVRATSRADGSQLGRNGCDNPGSFFVQLKDGKWVYVPEGLFIIFVPSWLDTFGLAGEGQPTPTTDLTQGSYRFCRD